MSHICLKCYQFVFSNHDNTQCENVNKKFRQLKFKSYRYLDLFAGTGAFSHCLDTYGLQCAMTNDYDKSSQVAYEYNFPSHNFVFGDLNDIDITTIPKHDILCGGFPCQPFSIAGKRLGFDDERSNVFFKILKIINNKKPQIVILENVKNLTTHDNGKTFKTIIELLMNEGYKIKYKVLDTCKYTGIPQHRERIYIVCFKDINAYNDFNFDFDKIPVNPIVDYLENMVDDKYYYDDRFSVYDKIKNQMNKTIYDKVLYQYRRHYVRENKSNCCPTLTANMGSGGHNVPLLRDNKGIRKLTPRECFNLQGFSQTYKLPELADSKLYKLAGNAVSVPIVKLILHKICHA